jgi:hypothetical protein
VTTDRITRRGRIAYVSDQPDDKGTARGGEEFSITRFDDGRMIQRAHCRITAPPGVERDSVVAVDANLRPVDAYVRIETGGKFTGTGWYVFGSDSILCETQTAEGLMSYSRDVPRIGPLPFCSHAIAGDAWMIAAAAPDQDGTRSLTTLYTSTLNKQGATGPELATLPFGIARIGQESVTVTAGTFDTVRCTCGEVPEGTALDEADFRYNIWITDDSFRMAVLSTYPGQTRFELIDFSEDGGSPKPL